MKNVLLLIAFLTSSMLSAQTGYEKAMTKGLQMVKDAQTAQDMNAASAFFERIAVTEKNSWLPYYYAAWTQILSGYMDEKADKDKVAHKANELISQADALQPDNSEIYCLKQMSASIAMLVDPMTRWQTYGMEAASALEKAKKLDPSNPRPYLLEAQGLYYTPEQFGGGKAKAKVVYEKAIQMYGTFSPASSLHPSWGLEQAQEGLKNCME